MPCILTMPLSGAANTRLGKWRSASSGRRAFSPPTPRDHLGRLNQVTQRHAESVSDLLERDAVWDIAAGLGALNRCRSDASTFRKLLLREQSGSPGGGGSVSGGRVIRPGRVPPVCGEPVGA